MRILVLLLLSQSAVEAVKYLVSFGGSFSKSDGIHFSSETDINSQTDFENLDSTMSQCLIFPDKFQITRHAYASYKHEKFKTIYFCGGIVDNPSKPLKSSTLDKKDKLNTCQYCTYGSINDTRKIINEQEMRQVQRLNELMSTNANKSLGVSAFKPFCKDFSSTINEKIIVNEGKDQQVHSSFGVSHGQMALLPGNRLIFIGGLWDVKKDKTQAEKPSNKIYINMLKSDGVPGKWLYLGNTNIPNMVAPRTGHQCVSASKNLRTLFNIEVICLGGLNSDSSRGPKNPLSSIEVLYKRPNKFKLTSTAKSLLETSSPPSNITYKWKAIHNSDKNPTGQDLCEIVYRTTKRYKTSPKYKDLGGQRLEQVIGSIKSTTHCWILLNTTMKIGRSGFSVNLIRDKIYIFGGQTKGIKSNDGSEDILNAPPSNSIEILEFLPENVGIENSFGSKIRFVDPILKMTSAETRGQSLEAETPPRDSTISPVNNNKNSIYHKKLNCGRRLHSSEIYNKNYIIIKGGVVKNHKLCPDIEIFDISKERILDKSLSLKFLDLEVENLNQSNKTEDGRAYNDINNFRRDFSTFAIDLDTASLESLFTDSTVLNMNARGAFRDRKGSSIGNIFRET